MSGIYLYPIDIEIEKYQKIIVSYKVTYGWPRVVVAQVDNKIPTGFIEMEAAPIILIVWWSSSLAKLNVDGSWNRRNSALDQIGD